MVEWNIQDYRFTEEQMLNVFKKEGAIKVKYHRTIPYGYHLCGCGNLAMGTNEDVLCQECQELYGHRYAYEL